MEKCFEVIRKSYIFKPGDLVKLSDERPRPKDYVIIKTKKGFAIAKFNYFIKKSEIIGKIKSIVRDL